MFNITQSEQVNVIVLNKTSSTAVLIHRTIIARIDGIRVLFTGMSATVCYGDLMTRENLGNQKTDREKSSFKHTETNR